MKGGSFTLEQIAVDINRLNTVQHGGFYVQKDLLCHAIRFFWAWLAQHGWLRSSPDESAKCRGLAIGSFGEQPKKNNQVIPATSSDLSIPQDSDLLKSLRFIAQLRDDILEASGRARISSVLDLPSFFPGTQSVVEELAAMVEYAGF